MWPISRTPRTAASTAQHADDRVAQASRDRMDRRPSAPSRSRNRAVQPPDLVDAGLGVAAAIDVDQASRGPPGRPAATPRRGRAAAPARRAATRGRASGGRSAGRSSGRQSSGAGPDPILRPRIVRLVEVRLLEGPNLYRLEPTVKLEVAVGRRRTWYGQRDRRPATPSSISAPPCRPASGPAPSRDSSPGCRRLRADARRGPRRAAPVASARRDPGHWIVTFPWRGASGRQTIAEARWRLAEARVSPDAGPPCRAASRGSWHR